MRRVRRYATQTRWRPQPPVMLLTLPSNVIDKEHPDNTNSSYTTVLPSPIAAEPGEYEIGLAEVQYTTTWSNVDGCSADLRYRRADGVYESSKITLRKGKYASHREVVREIGRLLVQEKFLKLNGVYVLASDVFSVMFDALSNRCALKSPDSALSVKFSEQLGVILGFEPDTWFCPASDASNIITNSRQPDIEAGMTALFIYCNLVSPRCVGGQNVRLLRAVTIPHKAERENVMREFQHTYYLPVESGSYRSVSIDIYRDDGTAVTFEGGKVIVTLHLKKRKN